VKARARVRQRAKEISFFIDVSLLFLLVTIIAQSAWFFSKHERGIYYL
jgi:hypothetical protein